MFELTYDLWKDIIAEIASAHESLFSALHQTAEEIDLTKDLVEELKKRGEVPVSEDPGELSLKIDFVGDDIGGFMIFLAIKEDFFVLEQIKADIASDRGFSLEDIETFEMDSGLDMDEEILVEIEETYGVRAEMTEDEKIVYELVVFDSRDIDDSRYSDLAWAEDIDN